MEKIEFISGYFEIYSEFSLILKMNESQFKKDPKSQPTDPFSISLHHFLAQLIAFMFIVISDYKKRLMLDKVDKIQQKLEKKKRKIFDEIFPKCTDPEYNNFDYNMLISRWKRFFSDQQIVQMEKILNHFGIFFYNLKRFGPLEEKFEEFQNQHKHI